VVRENGGVLVPVPLLLGGLFKALGGPNVPMQVCVYVGGGRVCGCMFVCVYVRMFVCVCGCVWCWRGVVSMLVAVVLVPLRSPLG